MFSPGPATWLLAYAGLQLLCSHLMGPTKMAGGFALASSMPLERRIEQSLLARLDPLPDPTRMLLLLAAADPTGDVGLLWRASAMLGLGPENLDAARQADALVVGARVSFRHPLIRSAVYRAASFEIGARCTRRWRPRPMSSVTRTGARGTGPARR